MHLSNNKRPMQTDEGSWGLTGLPDVLASAMCCAIHSVSKSVLLSSQLSGHRWKAAKSMLLLLWSSRKSWPSLKAHLQHWRCWDQRANMSQAAQAMLLLLWSWKPSPSLKACLQDTRFSWFSTCDWFAQRLHWANPGNINQRQIYSCETQAWWGTWHYS